MTSNLHLLSSVEELSRAYYSSEADDGYRAYPRSATDPLAIAVIERHRQNADLYHLCEATPTDVFMPTQSSPVKRDITMIGGAPFRSRSKPWPTTSEGVPYTFVAQFRFVESSDIVPRLPGEFLLIFARDNVPYEGEPSWIYFEWSSLYTTELMPERSIPPAAWPFFSYQSIRFRSADFCENKAESILASALGFGGNQRFHPMDSMLFDAILRWDSFKIGGCRPRLPFGDPDPNPNQRSLLCSLPSFIEPGASIKDDRWRGLLWRDGGTIAVYIDNMHKLSWELILY